jgi:hypothetical protein
MIDWDEIMREQRRVTRKTIAAIEEFKKAWRESQRRPRRAIDSRLDSQEPPART